VGVCYVNSDLSKNSMLLFTVWTSQGVVFGGTSMHIFDEADSLKQGKQKLIFYFDTPGNSHFDSHTHGGELYERSYTALYLMYVI
jgi:hypothetical protein